MPVHNAEVAAMFDQTADLLDIEGENPFRVRAYRHAARVIEALPQSIANMLEAGRDLSELPGIGKDLAGKIADIVKTGRFKLLDAMKRRLPGELGEIAALPGLGPKRVKLLYDKLKVRTLADLKRAVETGRLREVRGFGATIEQKLADALKQPRREKRFKLPVAEAEAEALVARLRDGGHAVVAGSYRRRRETVGDLDLLVTGKDGEAIGRKLVSYENVAEVLAHGSTRTTVVLRSGIQVDLRVVPQESYGAALLYFTGSKAHNIALRNLANERGWKLNEYGLFAGARRIGGATEEEVYKKLGLAFIPPELREDRGEVEAAQRTHLPNLIALDDIKGDLHVHTSWTDGTATIAEMAAAGKRRAYKYIAITDHSRRLTMAHGLDGVRLAKQIDEIDRVSEKLDGIHLLKGIEVDILADGRLDLSDSVLARLDVVVAAVHYNFDLSRDAQTKRIIRAMDNPHVSIIAHPTGRLIGEREPYQVDIDRLIAAARDRGCCLEINAGPDRLDLNDLNARAAKSAGARVAISSDAHAPTALDWMRYGVDQARRGWLEPQDVINTRPLTALKKLLKR